MQEPLGIAVLLLDETNYRLGPVNGQPAAIKAMIEDQKEHLTNLADDIVKNGLNPTELLIVGPQLDFGHFGLGGSCVDPEVRLVGDVVEGAIERHVRDPERA